MSFSSTKVFGTSNQVTSVKPECGKVGVAVEFVNNGVQKTGRP